MGKYFTTQDAAKFLGVTASRIRQLIIEERLKTERLGRDHLIQERELLRFAAHGKKKRGRPKKQLNTSVCVRNSI
jgi:site-specific DNA-methyltransferase (cytosine-N4-specific)